MTDNLALNLLRAQRLAAGTPDRNGWVQVWIHGSTDAIDAKVGRELMSFPCAG